MTCSSVRRRHYSRPSRSHLGSPSKLKRDEEILEIIIHQDGRVSTSWYQWHSWSGMSSTDPSCIDIFIDMCLLIDHNLGFNHFRTLPSCRICIYQETKPYAGFGNYTKHQNCIKCHGRRGIRKRQSVSGCWTPFRVQRQSNNNLRQRVKKYTSDAWPDDFRQRPHLRC